MKRYRLGLCTTTQLNQLSRSTKDEYTPLGSYTAPETLARIYNGRLLLRTERGVDFRIDVDAPHRGRWTGVHISRLARRTLRGHSNICNFETLCFVALAIHFENTASALIVRGFLDVRNAKLSSGFKVVGWKVGMWWVEMVCGKDFGVGESPFAGSWSGHTVPSRPRSDYSRMRGYIKSSLNRWLEIVIACEGCCGK